MNCSNASAAANASTAASARLRARSSRTWIGSAFYDTTLLFPLNAVQSAGDLTGVYVLDLSDPTTPVQTATPAFSAWRSPYRVLRTEEILTETSRHRSGICAGSACGTG